VSLFTFRRPQVFRALRHTNFRLFWFGQVSTLVGWWVQLTALNWLIYRLTDSALMLGLVTFVSVLPVGLVSLIGGVISDRFSKRKLILTTQAVIGAQALILAILTSTEIIQVWHIIVLMFVAGAADAVEQPARYAVLRSLVPQQDLVNAVGIHSFLIQISRIAGPAIAGVLIGWFGESTCFYITSVACIPSVGSLLLIRVSFRVADYSSMSLGSSVIDGIRYVWQHDKIRGILILFVAPVLFATPFITLMPVFAKDVILVDSAGYGFLMSSLGVGAAGGALVVASMSGSDYGRRLVSIDVALALTVLAFAFSRWLPVSATLLLLAGAALAGQQILTNTWLQISSAEAYQGRTMSIFYLLNNGLQRIGGLVAGTVTEYWWGASMTIAAGAILSLILVLLAAWRRIVEI
jgi:MFS family permease